MAADVLRKDLAALRLASSNGSEKKNSKQAETLSKGSSKLVAGRRWADEDDVEDLSWEDKVGGDSHASDKAAPVPRVRGRGEQLEYRSFMMLKFGSTFFASNLVSIYLLRM